MSSSMVAYVSHDDHVYALVMGNMSHGLWMQGHIHHSCSLRRRKITIVFFQTLSPVSLQKPTATVPIKTLMVEWDLNGFQNVNLLSIHGQHWGGRPVASTAIVILYSIDMMCRPVIKKNNNNNNENIAVIMWSYLPCLNADLHFTTLRLGHQLLGHSEFVEPSKAWQHHRPHLFHIPGRFPASRFLPRASLYHALGFLSHICSLLSHVGARLCASLRASSRLTDVLCSLQSWRCARQPGLTQPVVRCSIHSLMLVQTRMITMLLLSSSSQLVVELH